MEELVAPAEVGPPTTRTRIENAIVRGLNAKMTIGEMAALVMAAAAPPEPAITNDALIDAVANAHIGVPMKERHALMLLAKLGMDSGEAEELLADARHEATKA